MKKLIYLPFKFLSRGMLCFSYSKVISFLLFPLIFLLPSCDTADPPIPPEKPPGYQEEIPWPSLADSPWPMFRGNPQLTGRSTLSGPTEFISSTFFPMEWSINSSHSLTSIVIGLDTTIYFGSSFELDSLNNQSSYLYSVSMKGLLNWKYQLGADEISTSPLIASDGTIYVGSYDKHLYAITQNGNLKWKFNVNSRIVSSMINIDKLGNIYIVDNDGKLWSISSTGESNWNLTIDGGFDYSSMSGFPFSPNGQYLYIPGLALNGSKTMYSININGSVSWTYDNGGQIISAPIVESSGNILFGFEKAIGDIQSGVISLNQNGEVNWVYSSPVYFSFPSVDSFGNVYFGDGSNSGSIFSLNYSGELNWLVEEGFPNSNPVIDVNNNILFVSSHSNLMNIDYEGNILKNNSFDYLTWTSLVLSYSNRIFCAVVSPEKSIIQIK